MSENQAIELTSDTADLEDAEPHEERANLPPQEAQAALAEALDAQLAPNEEIPTDTDGEEDRVVTLAGDGEIAPALPENPFAAAAEFATHVRMVEALLFASADPLDEASIAERLPHGAKVKEIIASLQGQYENRGVTLRNVNKKWQFITAVDVAHVLEREQVTPKKLSRAALETLAIIAYHQPCTRAEIEEIRGVAISKGSLDHLLEISWIRLRGRKEDTPGRPLLYGTTQAFLENFGLEKVSHLPGMADLKAAGLLDARLPPDFVVPTPSSDDGVDDGSNDPAEAEFVQDFHDEPEFLDDEDVDLENDLEDTLDSTIESTLEDHQETDPSTETGHPNAAFSDDLGDEIDADED